jgi:hypothetical protein
MMFDTLSRNDIQAWADRFLNALERPAVPASGFEQIESVGLH